MQENLTYEAKPERIIDVQTKQLRNKDINLVKVFWRGLFEAEET